MLGHNSVLHTLHYKDTVFCLSFRVQTHNILRSLSVSNVNLGQLFKILVATVKNTVLTLVFPSGLSPAVVSLSSYVKRGIECWSNSGFHTPLITSISVGGLTIMDSKIFQSPLKTATRDGEDFFFWLMCLPRSKYFGILNVINTNIRWGFRCHSLGSCEVWCTIMPKD